MPVFLIGQIIQQFYTFFKDNYEGFIVGIICSSMVGIILYYFQKKDSLELRKQLLITLQSNDDEKFDDYSKNIDELLKNYNDLKLKIDKLLENNDLTDINILSKNYVNIANIISKEYTNKYTASFDLSNITINDLLDLHNKIFPQDYEIAGKLRNINIGIAGSTKHIPPDSKNVKKILSSLLNDWNHKYPDLINSSTDKKIGKITEFHHRFLSIHPFIDGNGRVARILLRKQIENLFDKELEIIFDRSEYYKALISADSGDLKLLKKLIQNIVTA